MIIPNYNIEPGQYDPEEIVDVVPEQAESNRKIQASEDNYLRQLETNEERRFKNTQNMLIDTGNGTLQGQNGSATIDYDTGIIDIKGPYRCEFKTSFAYGSAHSGIPTRASNNSNMVKLIGARSCNVLKNGELTLICYS